MNKGTSNALDILRDEFGDDEEIQQLLATERVTAQAAQAIYDARRAASLTQKQLAERAGTYQSTIARIEDNAYEGHTLSMLERVADALGLRVDVRFVSTDQKEEQDLRSDIGEMMACARDQQSTIERLERVISQQQATISLQAQQVADLVRPKDGASIDWKPNSSENQLTYGLAATRLVQH